ncbi:MAG: SDR family oxidoreductase [Pseudomonadota bacterium]
MNFGFKDRAIIVSGATGGFGRLAADALAAQGARLILTDLDADALQELAEGLDTECGVIAGDITDPQLSIACVDAAFQLFDRLDGAFNNAGIEHELDLVPGISLETVDRIMDVNFIGVLNALQAQLPALSQRFKKTGEPGAILNTASIAGVKGAPRLGVYSAAKHAVVGLSRSAALEYARHGVRINTLCPAFFKTRMVSEGVIKDFADPEEGYAKLASGIPIGRIGEPEEIVPAVLFGLSPANSFFTGQEIRLDGGLMA